MLRKLLIGVCLLLGAGITALAVGLVWAHVAIRRERAPLPTVDTIAALAQVQGLPIRLSLINTATQPMPRSAVLEFSMDPRVTEPYVMSHPAFVLEWADGRILLIDTGMTRDGAVAFGRLLERFAGAQPIQPLGAAAEQLGMARERVQGVVFTHLHTDHTGGIGALCAGLQHRIPVFMTEAQAERPNFTTRPGLALLRDAGCVQQERLSGGPLMPVKGFPGVAVIAAGGHTPGSQIVIAAVHTDAGIRTYVFAGDIVNNMDGIIGNIPKPFLYRWFMVPEDNARLDELRRFLRTLREANRTTVLVSHDQRQLEHSGVPVWQK